MAFRLMAYLAMFLVLSFIVWCAYSQHPVFGYSVLVVATLFFTWFITDSERSARQLIKSEQFLAELACPNCGTIFGASIARRALNPPKPKLQSWTKLVFHDDFGISCVECNECKTHYNYNRVLARLVWRDKDGELRHVGDG